MVKHETQPQMELPIWGKHTQRNLLLALIDRRGRCLWSSHDPAGGLDYQPTQVIDLIVPKDREKVVEMLSRCVVGGEIVQYEASSVMTLGDIVNWHVLLLPINAMLGGDCAVCAVCRRLPVNYDRFTEDDRELLKMLCQDCTLKEIAARLFLSESAIDSRMKGLKQKLDCKNIGGLVAAALLHAVI